MKFTIEQLEKIISEAPEGAEFYYHSDDILPYRKVIDKIIFVFRDDWKNAADNEISRAYLRDSYRLTDLANQLQEMKMNEDNKVEWNNGDKLYTPDGEEVVVEGVDLVYAYNEKHDTFEYWASSDLSKEKPLTPEQQAHIDEMNGELFKRLVDCEFTNQAKWDCLVESEKLSYIKLAKQIDFPGKLSA